MPSKDRTQINNDIIAARQNAQPSFTPSNSTSNDRTRIYNDILDARKNGPSRYYDDEMISRINKFNSMADSFNEKQKSFVDMYNELVGAEKFNGDYMSQSQNARLSGNSLNSDLNEMRHYLESNPWMMAQDYSFKQFYDETSKMLSDTQLGLDEYEKMWQDYANGYINEDLGITNVMTGADGKGYDMNDEDAWEAYLQSYQDAEAQAKQDRKDTRKATGFTDWLGSWYGNSTTSPTQGSKDLIAAREGFREAQQARVDAENVVADLKGLKSQEDASFRGYTWYNQQIENGTGLEDAYHIAEKNLDNARRKYNEELSKARSSNEYAGYITDTLTAANTDGALVGSTPELIAAAKAVDEANEAYEFAKFYRYADIPKNVDDEGYDPDIMSNGAAIAGRMVEEASAKDAEVNEAIRQHYNYGVSFDDYVGNIGKAPIDILSGKRVREGIQLVADGYAADDMLNRTLDPASVTDDEYNTWLYLLGSGRQVEADEYAKELNDEERKAKRLERAQKIEEWVNADIGSGDFDTFREFGRKVAGTALGVAAPVFTGVYDFGSNLMELAFTGDITEKEYLTPLQAGTVASAAIANDLNVRYGTIDDDVPVFGGKGWGDAYQLAESVMQSWLTMATFGAAGAASGFEGEALKAFTSAGTNTAFFFSAGSQGIYDALEKGISPQRAILMGVLNGTAEVLGETLSIENVLDNVITARTFRDVITGTLRQAGIEASEEAFTTILNTMSDEFVNRDKSDLNIALQQYLSQGMDYDLASKAAMKDWFNSIAQDAVGGFLSGGASGHILGSGAAMIANRISYDTAQAFDSAGTIDEAKSLGDAKLEAQAKRQRPEARLQIGSRPEWNAVLRR